MVKAIIIDDEKHCSDNLQWQLQQYCQEVEIVSVCKNAEQRSSAINIQQPQLVFLDVEMPGMTGFEMLEKLPAISFDIIFTTAFDQYAIRAIRFGTLDYLVKPVDKDELRAAVDKVVKHTSSESLKQLTALLTHIRKSNDLSFQKIALPTIHGYELVPLNNIIYCESKSNYTDIHLNNGQQILVSRTLKDIEELLNMHPFFRLHNSYLVNLQYAVRYTRGEGGFLVLNNDITVPVSRNKKEELLKLITHLSA
ncbi:MAG: response regulator transcription factor [Bacteroidetes bacterium]|nr:response regulator transcription factor [Bacteroidota bacterium]